MLYDSAGRENLKAGQNGLIWAAENDEMGTLKALLESGVDPNARFWSSLPDCVRQDVFAAQNLRRRLSPRLDGHLVAKILREDIVWNFKCIGAPDTNESRFYRACTCICAPFVPFLTLTGCG
jgi:ankyrin repeat protein